MKQVKSECYSQLIAASSSPRYGELIKFLIVQVSRFDGPPHRTDTVAHHSIDWVDGVCHLLQGLMTITETRVALQCRKADLQIVTVRAIGCAGRLTCTHFVPLYVMICSRKSSPRFSCIRSSCALRLVRLKCSPLTSFNPTLLIHSIIRVCCYDMRCRRHSDLSDRFRSE